MGASPKPKKAIQTEAPTNVRDVPSFAFESSPPTSRRKEQWQQDRIPGRKSRRMPKLVKSFLAIVISSLFATVVLHCIALREDGGRYMPLHNGVAMDASRRLSANAVGNGNNKNINNHNNKHDNGVTVDSEEQGEQEKCSIYLAPSSVSDSQNRPAGFGIFTTKPLPRGSYIFPHGTGPTVVIPDIKVNQNIGVSSNGLAKILHRPSWAHSVFLPPCAGFEAETDDPDHYRKKLHTFDRCMKATVNVGSLTNYHPYLVNVIFDDSDVYKDNMLSRYEDPGAGAFSYHMGEKWYTTRDVGAGEELFNEYGQKWFFEKELGEEGKNVPKRVHYVKAANIVRAFLAAMADKGRDESSLKQHELDGLLGRIYESDKLVHKILPSNVTEFVDMLAEAKRNAEALHKFPTYTFEYDDNDDEGETQYALSVARRTALKRTTEWIEQNGRCLDNIIPGPSSIPQAGQGAFAARDLKSGTIIAPAPTTLQITNKSSLNVYQHEQYENAMGETEIRSIGREPVTRQLLLNYCFGHEESSLVLCPATNANLINHCSTRGSTSMFYKLDGVRGQCDPSRGPNAEIRWATEFDPETSEWLDLSLEEIDRRVAAGRRGLSFEVVATRDIRREEEIFIDYGIEWEEAWAEHVANWQPPRDDGDGGAFVPVSTMNADKTAYLRTVDEERDDPYPHPQVHVACFVSGFYHPCSILRRVETTEPDPDITDAYPPPNLQRHRRLPAYHVKVYNMDGVGRTDEYGYWWHFSEDKNKKSVEMVLSTRHIRFFHGTYSSDQHLGGTFRRSIGVPDGMWPERWKDLGAAGRIEKDGAKANAL